MKNQLKTILLLGTLSALLVAFGPRLASYFFSDRIVLAMHRAVPLGPKGAKLPARARSSVMGRGSIRFERVRSLSHRRFWAGRRFRTC